MTTATKRRTTTTATKIDKEKERLPFLPRMVPKHYLEFEFSVYDHMKEFSPKTKYAFWDFYQLSNKGFYMAPSTDDKQIDFSVSTNGFRGRMSPEAAGITCTIFALNKILWKYEGQISTTAYRKILAKYQKLVTFARGHEEGRLILAAMD